MKISIFKGDCLNVLPILQEGSVDLVLTDPPYDLSSTGEKPSLIKEGTKFNRKTPINPNFEWDKTVSLLWVKMCFRVLKQKGVLITFYSRDKISYLIDCALENGFHVRDIGGWHKTNPVPQARKVKWCSAIELFAIFRKDQGHTFNWKLGQRHNVIVSPICQGNERTEHPTQKPEIVFEPFIKYFSNEGDIILDPFIGSGTTAVVCRRLNRNCIGIDNNANYIEIAKRRLNWGANSVDGTEFEYKELE